VRVISGFTLSDDSDTFNCYRGIFLFWNKAVAPPVGFVIVKSLEGREGPALGNWLSAHPGVEVISRDRSAAYAAGARTGAPGVQVAGRLHLSQRLAKAVERCVAA
jgi:hypothetical protein